MRVFGRWSAGPVVRTFVHYVIAFCSWPETASDVITGRSVGPIVYNKRVKFHDPPSTRFQEIPPKAAIFDRFSNVDNFREVANDVISGVIVVDPTGTDSTSNRSGDIRNLEKSRQQNCWNGGGLQTYQTYTEKKHTHNLVQGILKFSLFWVLRALLEEKITVTGEKFGRLARHVGRLRHGVIVDELTTGLQRRNMWNSM